MGNFQDVFGDVANPIINSNLSTGGVKAGFAGEGNARLSIAARADLAGVAPFGVAAKHQTLGDSVDICILIEGDFFFNPLIAQEVPMVAEDLAKPVMASKASDALERGTVNCLRSSTGGLILRSPWIHATDKLHGLYHGGIIGDVL